MSTPWPDLLRLAAARFHVPPDAFWRLSLTEWRALTMQETPPTLDRAGFDALARRYPDLIHE